MKIEGSHTFPAPRDTVWPMLQDPDVLARVMPGCEKLERVGENAYADILKIKIGPVQGKFNGDVKLSDIQDPESYTIEVNGKGAPGFVRGMGALRLEEADGATVLHYEGDAQVGGRLASVGQRLLDTSAKAVIRQSLDGLEQQVVAHHSAEIHASANGTPQAPPASAEAPSQVEFATGVAKNMLDEVVPPDEQGAFFTKVALGLAGVVVLLLLSEWWLGRVADKVSNQLKQ